jgi:hypothetical protein
MSHCRSSNFYDISYICLQKKTTSFRATEYDLEDRPLDPVTSLAVNTYDTISSVLHGATAGPLEAYNKSQLETQTRDIPGRSPSDNKLETDGNPYTSVVTSTASGVGDIISASLKMPVTFTHGLARGFHNVPRLYGDQTVRDEDKITGVKSGFTAAGKVSGHLYSNWLKIDHLLTSYQ